MMEERSPSFDPSKSKDEQAKPGSSPIAHQSLAVTVGQSGTRITIQTGSDQKEYSYVQPVLPNLPSISHALSHKPAQAMSL